MPTAEDINYVETTGPVTRVGVICDQEGTAVSRAKEELGVDVEPAFTEMTEWGFEVVFERGDYL